MVDFGAVGGIFFNILYTLIYAIIGGTIVYLFVKFVYLPRTYPITSLILEVRKR